MNLGNDNSNMQEDNIAAKEICNCPCQAEISSLRAEINRLETLLGNPVDDSSAEPAVKKLRLDECASDEDLAEITVNAGKASTSSSPAKLDEIFTDVVFRKIGSYLPVKDLLECRLVCKTWKTAASSVLRTRPTYLREYLDDDDVPRIIAWAKENPEIPFVGYQWSRFDKEKERDMRPFLSEFATELTQLLATYLPHLEVLDMTELRGLSNVKMSPEELSLINACMEKVHLPKLEVLILPSPSKADSVVQEFFTDFIKAAPRLLRILRFVPALTDAVVSAGMMDAVTTMEFKGSEIVSPFVQVTLNPPCRLSKLVVDDCIFWRQDVALQNAVWQAFVAVLRASRETLESLSIVDLGSQLRDLQPLFKLKRLHIKGNTRMCPETYRLFPEDVSDLFPKLDTVTLEFDYWQDLRSSATQYDVLRLFLWDAPLSSVTSLQIRFPMDKAGIVYFGRIFPNVTQLWVDWEKYYRVSNGKYREGNLWEIWTVPFNLERLEIHRFNPWVSDYFSLDSFITGIHESVCRNLRQAECAQLPMDSSYYKYLRGFPNILRFEETLRELFISVDYPPTHESRYRMSQYEKHEDSIVSPVSVVYGTNLMRNKLQLYLVYDHRKFYSPTFKNFLAPVKEDATITHQEFDQPRVLL